MIGLHCTNRRIQGGAACPRLVALGCTQREPPASRGTRGRADPCQPRVSATPAARPPLMVSRCHRRTDASAGHCDTAVASLRAAPCGCSLLLWATRMAAVSPARTARQALPCACGKHDAPFLSLRSLGRRRAVCCGTSRWAAGTGTGAAPPTRCHESAAPRPEQAGTAGAEYVGVGADIRRTRGCPVAD